MELSVRPVRGCYCDRLVRLYFWKSLEVERESFSEIIKADSLP